MAAVSRSSGSQIRATTVLHYIALAFLHACASDKSPRECVRDAEAPQHGARRLGLGRGGPPARRARAARDGRRHAQRRPAGAEVVAALRHVVRQPQLRGRDAVPQREAEQRVALLEAVLVGSAAAAPSAGRRRLRHRWRQRQPRRRASAAAPPPRVPLRGGRKEGSRRQRRQHLRGRHRLWRPAEGPARQVRERRPRRGRAAGHGALRRLDGRVAMAPRRLLAARLPSNPSLSAGLKARFTRWSAKLAERGDPRSRKPRPQECWAPVAAAAAVAAA